MNILVDPIEREFFFELLVPVASSIESSAHLLHTMAKTYYAVSKDHMINQIAGIGKMLLLQNDADRQAQLQKASNNTLVTSMKITDMARARHALYLQETQNRQAEYGAFITNLATLDLEELIG